MANLLTRGLRRPRAIATFFACFAVVGAVGTWQVLRWTRVASAYAFVRGDVVRVGSPIQGQIASVDVEPGQHVNEGDVLARLNDAAFHPEVDRARAAHQHAQLAVDAEKRAIAVERKRIDATRVQLKAAVHASHAEARAAAEQAKFARRAASRSQTLAGDHLVSDADADQAQTLARTNEVEAERRAAEATSAEAQLAALDVDEAALTARVQGVALLEADVQTAAANLSVAEAQLAQTVIRAQAAGVITRRINAAGASIKMGDPIVEMALDGPVSVEAWVDEEKLDKIHLGGAVSISFPGLGDAFAGRIDSIAMVTPDEVRQVSVTVPVANRLAKSRWIRLHIVLDKADDRLVPGLTAEVTILKKQAAQKEASR